MKRRNFTAFVATSIISGREIWAATEKIELLPSKIESGKRKKTKNRIRFKKDIFKDEISPGVWNISVGIQALGKYQSQDIFVEIEAASDPEFNFNLERTKVVVNSETGYRARVQYLNSYIDAPRYLRFKMTQINIHKTTGNLIETHLVSEVAEIINWK
jgi:hypothetical protein